MAIANPLSPALSPVEGRGFSGPEWHIGTSLLAPGDSSITPRDSSITPGFSAIAPGTPLIAPGGLSTAPGTREPCSPDENGVSSNALGARETRLSDETRRAETHGSPGRVSEKSGPNFGDLLPDPDVARLTDPRAHKPARSEFEEPFDPPAVARAYGRLLRSAHSSDLSDVESLGLVKVGLSDKLGRPIAIIVGAALPEAEELRELCGLLLVRTLDALAEGPYALVYVHTRCELVRSPPPLAWLRSSLGFIPRKFKANLRALYVVHPTLQLRLLLWLCSPLFGHHFWPSVCYADDLIELESYFPSAGNNGDLRTVQQYLPGFVRAYDAQRDSPLAARARELRAVDEAEAAAAVGINH